MAVSLKAGTLPVESRASLKDHKARAHIFAHRDWYQWGASVIREKDGLYHMFYSRWPRDNPRGMFGWLYTSQIAHATAAHPEGPYTHQKVVLKGFGEPQAARWDARNAHNPCITRMQDPQTNRMRLYLYYVATRDDDNMQNDWWDQIINQRVGVAVSDSFEGPWVRHSSPVIVPPNGPLRHYLTNPGVCQLPDGRFLMVLKGRAEGGGRFEPGPMLHGWALADLPTGPFVVQKDLLFPQSIVAEDPCVWMHGDTIYAAVKDWHGDLSGTPGISYVHGRLTEDGSIAWVVPENANISPRVIAWDDGKKTDLFALERPFVLLNGEGGPSHLFGAASVLAHTALSFRDPRPTFDSNKRVPHLPFNLCVPLVSE